MCRVLGGRRAWRRARVRESAHPAGDEPHAADFASSVREWVAPADVAIHVVRVNPDTEGRYECPSCGEEIVVPVELDAGQEQEYVEDCPVCCAPVVLRVYVGDDGEVSISAQAE